MAELRSASSQGMHWGPVRLSGMFQESTGRKVGAKRVEVRKSATEHGSEAVQILCIREVKR